MKYNIMEPSNNQTFDHTIQVPILSFRALVADAAQANHQRDEEA